MGRSSGMLQHWQPSPARASTWTISEQGGLLVPCVIPMLCCAGPCDCTCAGDHYVWHAAMAGMVHLSSTLSCGLLGELYMWRVGKSVEVHNWDHKGCIKNATRAAPTSPRSVLQAEEARPASSAFGRPGTHCEDLRRSATRRPGELQCHSAAAGAPAVQERPRGHRHRRQLCIDSTGAASCDHRTMCC